MNKQEAIKAAKQKGFTVSKEVNRDGIKTISVGDTDIYHDGGGSQCWKIEGDTFSGRVSWCIERVIGTDYTA